MIKINFNATTREAFSDKYLNYNNPGELVLPINLFSSPDEISAGEKIQISIEIESSKETIELSGTTSWKRPKPIKTPMRHIPAGVGIRLDDESEKIVVSSFIESNDFNDIDDAMVGGNYIKIKKDLLKDKKPITVETLKGEEKRDHPRSKLTIPIEVFANENVLNMKTKDLSFTGMLIETNEYIEINSEIVIVLLDETTKKQIILKALAVRAIQTMDTNFEVGVKIVFESPQQQKDFVNFILKYS